MSTIKLEHATVQETKETVRIWMNALYEWLETKWFVEHPGQYPTIQDVNKGVQIEFLDDDNVIKKVTWRWYDNRRSYDRDWGTVLKDPSEKKQRSGRAVPIRDTKLEQRRRELSAKSDHQLSVEDAAEFLYFPYKTDQDCRLFAILRPWLFNGIKTEGKLENIPELQHALEGAIQTEWWETWRVPYELKDGKPMETVAYLSNWLVKQQNIPMPNNVRRCIIKESTLPEAGKGLFADEDIEAGQIIAVYGGKEYDDQQDYEKERNGGKPIPKEIKEARHAYFFEGRDFVDGYRDFYLLEQGRWANDKRDTEGNNAEYIPEEDGSVYVKATKNIRKNQEIFVDYGPGYWKKKKK